MLTHEVMGLLALWILWVNTLLIAAAAAQEIRRLLERRRELGGLLRGQVAGAGPLAIHATEQVGRALDGDRPAVGFRDRRYESKVLGGRVQVGGAELEVVAAVGEAAEVWVGARARLDRAACGDRATFERVMAEAQRAKGHERKVEVAIGAGDPVFIAGKVEDGRIVPREDGPLLVSAIDPLRWIHGKIALAALFIVLEIAAALGCTLLALSAPVFGPLSIAGAALGLAFFLSAQPIGVLVKNAVRTPDQTALRGVWNAETSC